MVQSLHTNNCSKEVNSANQLARTKVIQFNALCVPTLSVLMGTLQLHYHLGEGCTKFVKILLSLLINQKEAVIRLLLVGESKLDLSNIDQSKGERLLMMHSQVIKAIPMS